jgi:peptide/nickel transport system permease protein
VTLLSHGHPAAALPGREPASRPGRGVLRTALRLRRTQVGLLLVLLLAGVAIVGPWVAPYPPAKFVAPPNSGPSGRALLGTDYLGQDVLSRFLAGGGTILATALAAASLGVVLGTGIGLVAAYARGRLDGLIMRSLDVVLAFPPIMLALVAVATAGPSQEILVVAVTLTTAPRVARVARGAAQPVVVRDFVAAAEALGLPWWRILLTEVLPSTLGPVLVEASLRLTYAVGLIASLAFLGLAPNPNGPNWGTMIQQNQVALAVQPWGVVLPIAAIAVLTIGTGLIGDGIARASAGIDRGHGTP